MAPFSRSSCACLIWALGSPGAATLTLPELAPMPIVIVAPGFTPSRLKTIAAGQNPVKLACSRLRPAKAVSSESGTVGPRDGHCTERKWSADAFQVASEIVSPHRAAASRRRVSATPHTNACRM